MYTHYPAILVDSVDKSCLRYMQTCADLLGLEVYLQELFSPGKCDKNIFLQSASPGCAKMRIIGRF